MVVPASALKINNDRAPRPLINGLELFQVLTTLLGNCSMITLQVSSDRSPIELTERHLPTQTQTRDHHQGQALHLPHSVVVIPLTRGHPTTHPGARATPRIFLSRASIRNYCPPVPRRGRMPLSPTPAVMMRYYHVSQIP